MTPKILIYKHDVLDFYYFTRDLRICIMKYPNFLLIVWIIILQQSASSLAQSPNLIKDINVNSADAPHSIPHVFCHIGNIFFFVANTADAGYEVWRTDGTDTGTFMLSDITPGEGGYYLVKGFAIGNNRLYFITSNPTYGEQLWETDGTISGTKQLTYILDEQKIFNGQILYTPQFLLFQIESGPFLDLWRHDFASDSTYLIKRLMYDLSDDSQFFIYDNMIFFDAADSLVGTELFVTDGTESGTELFKDLSPGVYDSEISSFITFQDSMYFLNDGVIMKSDGTPSGTVSLVIPEVNFISIDTIYEGKLILTGENYDTGNEIYISDGTENGTSLLKDIYSGSGGSNPRSFISFQSNLYFVANASGNVAELWKTDGTLQGTIMVKDINMTGSASIGTDPPGIYKTSSYLIFPANDGIHGSELWRSDGTETGTVMVKDIFPGQYSSIQIKKRWDSKDSMVYFLADNDTLGAELWRTNGTTYGTSLVKDINASPPDILVLNQKAIDGKLFFTCAIDDYYKSQFWITDGTETGSFFFKDFITGDTAIGGLDVMKYENKYYFLSYKEKYSLGYLDMWQTDGSESETKRFLVLEPGCFGPIVQFAPNMRKIEFYENKIYFEASTDSSFFDMKLWSSDGTLTNSSEVLCSDLNDLVSFTNFKGNDSVLYFIGRKGITDDIQLWSYNDNTNSAIQLSNLSNYPEYYDYLYYDANRMFIVTDASNKGVEMLYSDGTPQNTHLMDIQPGSAGSYPSSLLLLNDTIYFIATTLAEGREFFKTDLTGSFVKKAFEILPGPNSSVFSEAVLFNGKIYFAARDSIHGIELWKSDGTASGTSILKEIYPGKSGSDISAICVWNNELYFSAADSIHGKELWKSDGTEQGTQLVEDIFPGILSSEPQGFSTTYSKLYFTCYHPDFGKELWVLDNGTTNAVEMYQTNSNLFVFPNPADAFIMVDLVGANPEIFNFEIFNVAGVQLIKKQAFLTSSRISVSNLPDGIYLIRVFSSDSWYAEKFVVQH